MRSEQELMELILDVAKRDDRIRAVAMNGSRVNPNAPKDMFQDYDIVYLVSEIDSYLSNQGWVDVFGERMIMQTPETMALFPPSLSRGFTYLMQFTDGNRIDLTLIPLDDKDKYCKEDKLTVILLDKDNCLPALVEPTDEDYWAKPPSVEFFADCCNEFWWVSPYVAKGLWRNEILFAVECLNNYVRPMLFKMLEWNVGIQTDFSVSIGKHNKYLQKYLPDPMWQELLSTYAGACYEGTWNALFAACDLFRSTAETVAAHFGYLYPYEDDQRVTSYLKHIRELPPIAQEI